jgi:imidazolonepropionase-like amidohydrolase
MHPLFRVFCFLFVVSMLPAQTPMPAPAQKAPILIMGAVAHLGNGKIIPNSAIAFENGKITMVADATTLRYDRTKYSKIFDATGKQVYPGFIATNTSVGLVEIDAIRATVDNGELGTYNPNARAIIAYDADSEIPPTLRSNGILMAQSCPEGGAISGISAVVQLDAWNWEDAFIKEDGVHLNWPAQRRFGGGPVPGLSKNEGYDKEVQTLQQFFSEARNYLQNATPPTVNLKFEALRSLFEQKANLYIHTDQAKTIEEAVLFAEQFKLKPVIAAGDDVWKVAGFLKAHQVPVILPVVQRLPTSDDEDIDQPFKTARQLYEAGVLFAFSDRGSWRQHNLPFQAGQSVGAGLPYEMAVRALTLDAATILGIGNSTGSLEAGKDATLFISEGDALDMRTCIVTAAFIQGREIDLDNRHKRLARKFGPK